MAPETNFDVNKYLSPNSDISSLTPEQQQLVLEKRATIIATRNNQLLTDSISGNLEKQYDWLKNKKNSLQAAFDRLHTETVLPYQSQYSQALYTRVKSGFNKHYKKDIFSASENMLANYENAYKNLMAYGNLGNIRIGLSDTSNTERVTNYVSKQQDAYAEQNQRDLANYEFAQEEYNKANTNVQEIDRMLTAGIDDERGLVAEMRFVDEQMRFNVAQQNFDYLG